MGQWFSLAGFRCGGVFVMNDNVGRVVVIVPLIPEHGVTSNPSISSTIFCLKFTGTDFSLEKMRVGMP